MSLRIAGLLLLALLSACTRSTYFLVTDARLPTVEERDKQEEGLVALSGHRIDGGSGYVAAIRRFRGSPLMVDSGRFEKVSIYFTEVSDATAGHYEIDGTNSGVFVFWSEGDSAFPENSVCWGNLVAGTATVSVVTANSARIEVEGDKRIIHRGATECGDGRFEEDATFRVKSRDELTPWEGRSGTSVLDESHP